jgi:hypothetical protein
MAELDTRPRAGAPPMAREEARHLAAALVVRQERRQWSGADPYDGLASPLASVLAGRRPRQALIQAVRRSPVNLRPLLGIGPRRMAAATGLAASAASRLAAEPFWAERRDQLGGLTAARQLGQGPARGLWGYEFDVQTRWAAYEAGSANAIATVMAARGCLDAGSLDPERQGLLARALLRCLWRGTHFAYTPDSDVLIHNANLLVASLAARLAGDGATEASLRASLRRAAAAAVATALAAQRPDGSWPYGEGRRLGWVDGYHTAYSLLALDDAVALLGGASEDHAALERGARFYFGRLFDGAVPRFLAGPRAGPSDVNNVATGLRAAVWGASRGHVAGEFPRQVLTVLKGLWDPRGGYFRASASRRRPTARLDYPRWGAAPALDALTALAASNQEGGAP